jgi:uncharacterized protein YbgA (DUF1722 family)
MDRPMTHERIRPGISACLLGEPLLVEERIVAHQRLTALFAGGWTMGSVVRFHTAYKLTLMAHMPAAYQRLGRLVASGKSMPRQEFQERYSREFMRALTAIATPRRHANVLQHMLGYFKRALDGESRAELLALIEDYAAGRVPLAVPLTLFAHHIRRCGVRYLAGQVYLQPHLVELMLRNHATQ